MNIQSLPWGVGAIHSPVEQAGPDEVNIGLYHVTGPYGLSSFVLAKSGQDASLALVRGEKSSWSKHGVFDDQCQAEFIGHQIVPKKVWALFIAELDSPFGLVINKTH